MNALTQVYELQQKELAKIATAAQAAKARLQREIAAFQNSGFPDVFRQFADMPLRKEIRQRVYGTDFKSLAWAEQNPCNNAQVKDVSLRGLNSLNCPRWWCATSLDTGQVRYLYQSGKDCAVTGNYCDPDGEWLQAFIEYAAAACDTAAVAAALQKPPEPIGQQTPQRRKLIAT